MLKFFLENFFAAPTAPQPTNRIFPKNRNFKKWPFSTFCDKIAPMRCSMWPYTPKFFLQGQVFNFQSTKKIFFWSEHSPSTHFESKIFNLSPFLKFRPPKSMGCGFRSAPKKFSEKHLMDYFKTRKKFWMYHHFEKFTIVHIFQFWAFELLNQNPVRLSQVV